jgi:hypothetical protein
MKEFLIEVADFDNLEHTILETRVPADDLTGVFFTFEPHMSDNHIVRRVCVCDSENKKVVWHYRFGSTFQGAVL